MENRLQFYYANNAKKLRIIVDKILLKFGGLSNKDVDSFYSIANEVFVNVLSSYDKTHGSFEGYLYSCLLNKVKSEITYGNRQKRKIDIIAIPIETSIGDDENFTLKDVLVDTFDLEKKIFGEEDVMSDKIKKYMDRLSKLQRNVVYLLSHSYKSSEIQQKLHITYKQYTDAMVGIRAYENVSILF